MNLFFFLKTKSWLKKHQGICKAENGKRVQFHLHMNLSYAIAVLCYLFGQYGYRYACYESGSLTFMSNITILPGCS